MTMTLIGGVGHALVETVAIRHVGIDDFSEVRYLHAKSLSAQTADSLLEAEAAAFVALANSTAYGDILAGEDIYGAFIDGQLIGTAAWHVNGDDGKLARISSVFVHPLFGRYGIARRLMAEVEARAFQSGFDHFSVSAPFNAVPFFEKMGYQVCSRGVKTFSADCSLPVAFLRKAVPRPARATQSPGS